MPLNPGQFVGGRYEIIKQVAGGRLGGGNMSVVYEAMDLRTNKPVAVKEVDPVATARQFSVSEQEMRSRFNREAQNLESLHHQRLPEFVDSFDDNNLLYLVMEWIDGQTLESFLATAPKLSERRTIQIALETLEVLEYLHNQGIVYRDIKPENMMVSATRGIILIDLGIIKISGMTGMLSGGRGGATTALGTGDYAPAELREVTAADGSVIKPANPVPQSDIFCLGWTMWRCLSGKTTPHAPDQATSILTVRPDLNPVLDNIVLKATEELPENRFDSAQDMREALENIGRPPPPPMVAPTRIMSAPGQLPTQRIAPTATANWLDRLLRKVHLLPKPSGATPSQASTPIYQEPEAADIVRWIEQLLDITRFTWHDPTHRANAEKYLAAIKTADARGYRQIVQDFYERTRSLLFEDMAAAAGIKCQRTSLEEATPPAGFTEFRDVDPQLISTEMLGIEAGLGNNPYLKPKRFGIITQQIGNVRRIKLCALVGKWWYMLEQ